MEYLAAVETVFKTEKSSQNAKQELFEGPSKAKPESHDQFDSMVSFSSRSSKKCRQKDREIQKKQAEVLHYGKVPGERMTETDSERFQKTYEGKQVNFEFDIRRLCGQVSLNTKNSCSFVIAYTYSYILKNYSRYEIETALSSSTDI